MAADLPQRLAAILAADVAGYTRLMELDETGTVAAWRRARSEVIDPTIEQQHGRIIKLTGDGFLAEFSTVESAVRAALRMQELLASMFRSVPSDRRVAFRMGVNIGDVWVDAEDVYGTGVNVAARLEGLAPPGGICVSDAVHEAVKHNVAAAYVDGGLQRVKNVAEPVRVWHVSGGARGKGLTARRKLRHVISVGVSATVFLTAGIGLLYLGRFPFATTLLPFGPRSPPAAARSGSPSPATVEPDSVAVLPFRNIDGSEETRIFSDGLAEDLINRLTATPPLRVSSRGDSFAFGPDPESSVIRNRLRVAYYVEGSVRKTLNSLRVVAQLIDSSSGFQVVSRTFDKNVGNFSELQDEITKLIVANLRVALPSLAEVPVYTTPETASFDAYLAYRRGMDIIHRPITPQSVEQALKAFRESLQVDPGYAAAFAGICLTYTGAYDVTRDTAYIDQAERSCGSALDKDANLVVVRDALGQLYLHTGRYVDAEQAFERALTTNANDVQALRGLGDVYQSQGRLSDAERRYRQAVGLEPGNWRTYNSLGTFLFNHGRYAEAAGAYGQIVVVDPDNATGWANLASSSMLDGDFTAGERAFQHALDLQPSSRTLMNLGLVYYYQGNTTKAELALRKAIAMTPQDYLAWSSLGDVLAIAGKHDGSREAFTEAARLAREQLAVNSQDPGVTQDLAWINAMLDDFDEAQRLIDVALKLAPGDPYVHYYDALIRARMGEPDQALDRLHTAVEKGYPVALIWAEPHLAELRSRPRFIQLVGEKTTSN